MAPRPAATRRIAVAVWAAMLGLPLAFLAMSESLTGPRSASPSAGSLLFWMAVAASALGVALSRALPRRLTPSGEGASPEVVAFTRLAVGWALVEAVALFPLVARLVAPDPRLLAVFAADLLVLLTLFPGERRWAHLARLDQPPGPERG